MATLSTEQKATRVKRRGLFAFSPQTNGFSLCLLFLQVSLSHFLLLSLLLGVAARIIVNFPTFHLLKFGLQLKPASRQGNKLTTKTLTQACAVLVVVTIKVNWSSPAKEESIFVRLFGANPFFSSFFPGHQHYYYLEQILFSPIFSRSSALLLFGADPFFSSFFFSPVISIISKEYIMKQ